MRRDYAYELATRVEYIKGILLDAGAKGIVFGNSGGKDSALVGILCKKACDNTVGIMMPCDTSVNYGTDIQDANNLADMVGIDNITVDLTNVKKELIESIPANINDDAKKNIPPRLRMTALYAVAQERNCLVAGTGNRSENHLGYFTKWGDGAYDFNPISDLTVTEIYEFLNFLNAPQSILTKPPSGGLFEGQTDEQELGISYRDVDHYLLDGLGDDQIIQKIEKMHKKTEHKRNTNRHYGEAIE